MKDQTYIDHPILAIYPTRRSFGYVLFSELGKVKESGMATPPNRMVNTYVDRLSQMIEIYNPSVLLLPRPSERYAPKREKKQELIDAFKAFAKQKDIVVYTYSRNDIWNTFNQFHCANKVQIAQTINRWFTNLAKRCPIERPNYVAEDYFQPLYDAVSLVMTYYSQTIDLNKTFVQIQQELPFGDS